MSVDVETVPPMLRHLLVSHASTTSRTMLVGVLLATVAGHATAEEPGSAAAQPGVNAPPVPAHMLGDAELFDLTMANLSDDALESTVMVGKRPGVVSVSLFQETNYSEDQP